MPSPNDPAPIHEVLAIDRFLGPVRAIFKVFGLVILTVMIATPALQVFMRQVIGYPMIGAEEVSRFMLISVVMLAIPYSVSSGASVRMEEFQQVLPVTGQRILRCLIAFAGLAAFAFATYSVLTAMLKNLNNSTPTLGIPYYIFFSATALGFFYAAVEFGVLAWKAMKGLPMFVDSETADPLEDLTL
ncbi:TRAP transporter small permease [Hoeflea sp.]|uniref:TRAP transporter small permease n=1 Tax=Hoeflea sp. TaxID=1940281 RepID=UPI003A947F67